MSIADAVIARLSGWAATQSSLIGVYDTTIPGQPVADPDTKLGRYVVISERTSVRGSGVDGVSRDASGEIYIVFAAWLVNASDSPVQALRWLIDAVRDQLVDWIPNVPGLQCGPLSEVGNPIPRPEETSTDRHLIYASDQFAYQADLINAA